MAALVAGCPARLTCTRVLPAGTALNAAAWPNVTPASAREPLTKTSTAGVAAEAWIARNWAVGAGGGAGGVAAVAATTGQAGQQSGAGEQSAQAEQVSAHHGSSPNQKKRCGLAGARG